MKRRKRAEDKLTPAQRTRKAQAEARDHLRGRPTTTWTKNGQRVEIAPQPEMTREDRRGIIFRMATRERQESHNGKSYSTAFSQVPFGRRTRKRHEREHRARRARRLNRR